MGGQGNLEQLKMSAETVSLLGFNVVNAYWWGAIAPRQIDSILDSYGLERRMVATYNPPSYFDFDQDKINRLRQTAGVRRATFYFALIFGASLRNGTAGRSAALYKLVGGLAAQA